MRKAIVVSEGDSFEQLRSDILGLFLWERVRDVFL
jgi:hypothetical protein